MTGPDPDPDDAVPFYLNKATCKCGQIWGFSRSEPSPVTAAGCPTCSPAARAEMVERDRVACLSALQDMIARSNMERRAK